MLNTNVWYVELVEQNGYGGATRGRVVDVNGGRAAVARYEHLLLAVCCRLGVRARRGVGSVLAALVRQNESGSLLLLPPGSQAHRLRAAFGQRRRRRRVVRLVEYARTRRRERTVVSTRHWLALALVELVHGREVLVAGKRSRPLARYAQLTLQIPVDLERAAYDEPRPVVFVVVLLLVGVGVVAQRVAELSERQLVVLVVDVNLLDEVASSESTRGRRRGRRCCRRVFGNDVELFGERERRIGRRRRRRRLSRVVEERRDCRVGVDECGELALEALPRARVRQKCAVRVERGQVEKGRLQASCVCVMYLQIIVSILCVCV